MKNEITVKEAKKQKKLMEKKIVDAIVEFEYTTGLKVDRGWLFDCGLLDMQIKNPF